MHDELRSCWNPNFCEFWFQTLLCIWKPNFWVAFQTFSKKCLKTKLFENRTVIECVKAILVCISDTHCKWQPTTFKMLYIMTGKSQYRGSLLQWNADIWMSEIRTMPKSKQNGLPFPDVRILNIRAVRFVRFEIFSAKLDHFSYKRS